MVLPHPAARGGLRGMPGAGHSSASQFADSWGHMRGLLLAVQPCRAAISEDGPRRARRGPGRGGGGRVKMRAPNIRLGGRAVLSVSAFLEAGHEPEASSTTSRSTIGIDWSGLLRLAGFNSEEAALVVAHRLQGVTRGELPERLGWSPREAERVRKAVQRKLRRLQSQPTGLTRLSRRALIGKRRASDPSGATVVVRYPGGGVAWELRGGP
jgi:hypothetical protein